VAPERASLAFGDSPIDHPEATGGYYLQGELLANAIDALVRDSTHDRRGLDDIMRALFRASQRAGYHGYTSAGLESTVDSVCGCRAAAFFEMQVRGNGPIDLRPALNRLGLVAQVDSIAATDAQGQPVPDRRVGIDFDAPPGVVRVLVTNPATPWASGGLRTGDVITAFDGAAVTTIRDLQNGLSRVRIGDRVTLTVRRAGIVLTISVPATGYVRTRVRITDTPVVTAQQRARREAWLRGY
jgi:predicted metalloprotease with PDZ domain